jgi:L-proline amide hydrolase
LHPTKAKPLPVLLRPQPLKTWYKAFGDLSISNSNPPIKPLIIIHGGPGMTHHYLTPRTYLAEHHSIPIILYDQLGCGNSTHLPELAGDTLFWTVDLFIAELDNLISHLGYKNMISWAPHGAGC